MGIGGSFMGETGGSDPTSVDTAQKSGGLQVTSRDFLIGAGAGAATAGVVFGGAIVVKNAVAPETTSTQTGTTGAIPATMRRVAPDIVGVPRDLIVDNRESLWDAMEFQ